jgi:hypothetical protein
MVVSNLSYNAANQRGYNLRPLDLQADQNALAVGDAIRSTLQTLAFGIIRQANPRLDQARHADSAAWATR